MYIIQALTPRQSSTWTYRCNGAVVKVMYCSVVGLVLLSDVTVAGTI